MTMGANKRKPSRDISVHSRPPAERLYKNQPLLPVEEVAEQLHRATITPKHISMVSTNNSNGVPPMLDPIGILNSEDMDAEEAANRIPKDERPIQPHNEREYFERLWAANFQRSEVQYETTSNDIREALTYIPVGGRGKLVRISGYSLARDKKTSKLYTVFRIEMECDMTEKRWTIYRRYQDFKQLSQQLKTQGYRVPLLPPKTILRSFSSDFLQKRQNDLQIWLLDLINNRQNQHYIGFCGDVHDSDTLRLFLCHMANRPPDLEESRIPINNANTNTSHSINTNPSSQLHISNINTTLNNIASNRSQRRFEFNEDVIHVDEVSEKTNNLAGKSDGPRLKVDDFDLLRVVGKGSFGKVMLVRKKDSGELFAMKMLSKPVVVKKKQVEHTRTERRVLGSVVHPFIVRLHYAFQTNKKLFFVLDYCPGGDLFFHLSRCGCFPELMAKFYAAEITLALEHLHNLGVVYRDLKPENIMLDVDGHVKLADFGLAKEGITHEVEGTNTMCGTPEYLPPEILNRDGHGTAVDWWNLGMVLYEMLTGRPPWYTTDRMKLFLRLRKAKLEFPEGMSQASMDLITGLLNRDPSLRLGASSADELKNHPFFADIDWELLYQRKIAPPFQPCQFNDPLEAANFETAFTQIPVNTDDDSIDDNNNKQTPEGRGSALRALSYTFQGFTFESHGIH